MNGLLACFSWFAIIVQVHSFGLLPSPTGLSQDAILSMAQRRYPISGGKTKHNDPNNQYPLNGKVVVVTGAAGGIGGELAKLMYNLGGDVVAMDRNKEGLVKLEQSLRCRHNNNNKSSATNDDNTGSIWTLVTHHEDLSSVASSAEQIKSRYDKIDILINNAGLTYRGDSIPGSPNMKAANGKDLSFTVNYLSHFLLTEKLLPHLSKHANNQNNNNNEECEEGGGGRIIHITSTYHWKVDGSELVPQSDGSGPIAYQSNPDKQGPKHVERAYANSKLAQIWHSLSINSNNKNTAANNAIDTNCYSVCACPTWAATGIGGEDARSFLQTYAFGIENCGPGVTSSINAILRTNEELGDALLGTKNGKSFFVANSRILEYIPWKEELLSGEFVTNVLKWRDGLTDVLGLVLLFGQKFTHEEFIIQETSPDSFGNVEERRLFHEWSLEEVKDYL